MAKPRSVRKSLAGKRKSSAKKKKQSKTRRRRESTTASDSSEAWTVYDILHHTKINGINYFLVSWAGVDPATGEPWEQTYEPESGVGEDLLLGYRLKHDNTRLWRSQEGELAAARTTIHWYLYQLGEVTEEYKRQERAGTLFSSCAYHEAEGFQSGRGLPEGVYVVSPYRHHSEQSSPSTSVRYLYSSGAGSDRSQIQTPSTERLTPPPKSAEDSERNLDVAVVINPPEGFQPNEYQLVTASQLDRAPSSEITITQSSTGQQQQQQQSSLPQRVILDSQSLNESLGTQQLSQQDSAAFWPESSGAAGFQVSNSVMSEFESQIPFIPSQAPPITTSTSQSQEMASGQDTQPPSTDPIPTIEPQSQGLEDPATSPWISSAMPNTFSEARASSSRKRSLSASSTDSDRSQSSKRARLTSQEEALAETAASVHQQLREQAATTRIDVLERQLEMERSTRNELEVSLNQLQTRFEDQSRENQLLKTQLAKSEAANENSNRRITKLTSDSAQLREERSVLRTEMEGLRQALLDSKIPELEEFATTMKQAERVPQLEKRLELAQGDLAYTQEKYQTASAAGQDLSEETDNLREEIKQLRSKADGEATKLRAMFQDNANKTLSSELRQLKAEKQQLEQALTAAGQEQRRLTERLEREERLAGMSLSTRSRSPSTVGHLGGRSLAPS